MKKYSWDTQNEWNRLDKEIDSAQTIYDHLSKKQSEYKESGILESLFNLITKEQDLNFDKYIEWGNSLSHLKHEKSFNWKTWGWRP